jgi:hypothetical protein
MLVLVLVLMFGLDVGLDVSPLVMVYGFEVGVGLRAKVVGVGFWNIFGV